MLSHFLLCYPQTDIQTDTHRHTYRVRPQSAWQLAAHGTADLQTGQNAHGDTTTTHTHTQRSSYNRYMSISTTLWIKMGLVCTSFPLGRNTMVFPDTSGFEQHNVLCHAEKT